MKVQYKKLYPKSIAPKQAYAKDAGFDVHAITVEHTSDKKITYGTGLAFNIPEGYYLEAFCRSSVCKYDISLTNSVGIIDNGYKGEVKFVFRLNTPFPSLYNINYAEGVAVLKRPFCWIPFLQKELKIYRQGERIGQLILKKQYSIKFEEVKELENSDRGARGFGSSDKVKIKEKVKKNA